VRRIYQAILDIARSARLLLIAFAFWYYVLTFGRVDTCMAYTLYGFEDTYGVVHLNEAQLDSRYVLLYSGEAQPKLGFPAIRKLIREKGGVEGPLNKAWVRDNVLRGGALVSPRRLPRLTLTAQMRELITRTGKKHNVEPELVCAVIEQESGFQAEAVSPKGAAGIMQLMPDTQRYFRVSEPFDVVQNIDAGTRYLRWLLDRYGSMSLALAAYNAGPATVDQHGGIPPFPETQAYVGRVIQRYSMLKNM